MSSVPQRRLSAQEYLQIERAAETRSEFFAGETFAMTGASRRHNLIVTNVSGETSSQLKDRPCEVYASDMRVKVSRTGLYTYPAVIVVCDEPQFEDAEVDTLLNPNVLFEVLSESTEDYDRGRKFANYRQLDSLRAYVLIAQDRPHVEMYTRQPNNDWLLSETSGLDAVLTIPSIDCRLALAEIYDKVQFDEPVAESDLKS